MTSNDPAKAASTSADVRQFMTRFHVDMEQGAIWLDDHRILMLQGEWFSDLREQLIEQLGQDGARAVLTRTGHTSGVRDALTAMKLGPEDDTRKLIATGGEFHAFQGSARAEPLTYEFDLAANHLEAEFLWHNTIESEAAARSRHPASGPTCWMEVGYASGYLSTIVGRDVVVREVACASNGAAECRCVARFADEWADGEDTRYLNPAQFLGNTPDGAETPTDNGNSKAAGHTNPDQLIGRSAAFESTLRAARRVGATGATTLLLGESGVGKSALARFIHKYSMRADRPFVEINCAAIPENLLEAELFGVERGAFTGAIAARIGRFEEAHGGTLFLDEVGLLTPAAQGKLLRVLQTQQFERLGSNKTRSSDVRLLAATNDDLWQAAQDGSFRSDLYYRLNVFPIVVPPIRSRLGDLPLLIAGVLRRIGDQYGTGTRGITALGYRALLHHSWPGNIRELENVLERAVILTDPGELIDLHHLLTSGGGMMAAGVHWLTQEGRLAATEDPAAEDAWVDSALAAKGSSLESVERAVFVGALKATRGNILATGKKLGITRAQVDYRLAKWGLNVKDFIQL